MNWENEITDKYKKNAINLTKELVNINSSNPPGNELEIGQYIRQRLMSSGFEVRLEEFESKRCNVIATLGDSENIGIILNGHLDVVPATGKWTYPPFKSYESSHKIYGRGSCDMKSGIAAMITVAEFIAHNHMPLKRGLEILLVSDEETTNKGIKNHLLKNKLKADGVIIAEPTSLNVCIGNKGYASFFVRTYGKATHASQPEKGENAIYKMARIINRFEEYSKKVIPTIKHDFLGSATFSVGTIAGGTKINIVPDYCQCEIERRILPGENQRDILLEMQNIVGDLGEVFDRSYMDASMTEQYDPLVQVALETVSESVNMEMGPKVFSAGTEASFFTNNNIPTIILGPGSIEQAHTIDEYVEIKEIEKACEIYYKILKYFLNQ